MAVLRAGAAGVGETDGICPFAVTLFAPSAAPNPASVQLRPGELQVARLAAEGLSDRKISERLHLSIGTVGERSVAQLPQIGHQRP